MAKLTIFTALLMASLSLQAANITTINRYASVKNKPTAAQINPLNAIQQIHFPTTVKTIAEAVNYWLNHSGYHLVSVDKQCSQLKLILKQPLPQVDRNLGPLSIEQGLTVLVGHRLFSLKHDDLRREVNFILIKRRKT